MLPHLQEYKDVINQLYYDNLRNLYKIMIIA